MSLSLMNCWLPGDVCHHLFLELSKPLGVSQCGLTLQSLISRMLALHFPLHPPCCDASNSSVKPCSLKHRVPFPLLPPLSTTQTHRPNSKPHDPRPATPLAAIVVPSILIPVAAFAVIVFYVARRRVRRQKQEESLSIGDEEGAEERRI